MPSEFYNHKSPLLFRNPKSHPWYGYGYLLKSPSIIINTGQTHLLMRVTRLNFNLFRYSPEFIRTQVSCSYHIFFNQFSDVLGYENGSIGAATITVIVVHVIIGLYIWVAIQEEQQPKPLKKD